MASVSINMTVAQATDMNDESLLTGTNAPGTGDIELRVDMAKFTSVAQIFLALEKFEYFLNNSAKGQNTFKVT